MYKPKFYYIFLEDSVRIKQKTKIENEEVYCLPKLPFIYYKTISYNGIFCKNLQKN